MDKDKITEKLEEVYNVINDLNAVEQMALIFTLTEQYVDAMNKITGKKETPENIFRKFRLELGEQ